MQLSRILVCKNAHNPTRNRYVAHTAPNRRVFSITRHHRGVATQLMEILRTGLVGNLPHALHFVNADFAQATRKSHVATTRIELLVSTESNFGGNESNPMAPEFLADCFKVGQIGTFA